MASIGKKILSAFLEVEEQKKVSRDDVDHVVQPPPAIASAHPDQRFSDYFDKLFSEANIPGPDYYEFARMITAMQTIPDERARYAAAFAGLQVQGLDKDKLLSTAGDYLRVLTADADHFNKTVDEALQEKVHARTAEVEDKGKRIQALSQEILALQSQIGAMQNEIGEAKGKLEANSSAYAAESERHKQQIQADISKIEHYIR
ncbi:MAG TPA: hypothetical protein VG605_03045 [Puia sp.]|nr:hypothetical protein [Puia sp.]